MIVRRGGQLPVSQLGRASLNCAMARRVHSLRIRCLRASRDAGSCSFNSFARPLALRSCQNTAVENVILTRRLSALIFTIVLSRHGITLNVNLD